MWINICTYNYDYHLIAPDAATLGGWGRLTAGGVFVTASFESPDPGIAGNSRQLKHRLFVRPFWTRYL